jgi:metal-dependent amidase/aminoacylase/carboxypeptidase family protein
MAKLRERFAQVVANTAAAFGCEADVDWMQDKQPYYPPLINDVDAVELLREVAAK